MSALLPRLNAHRAIPPARPGRGRKIPRPRALRRVRSTPPRRVRAAPWEAGRGLARLERSILRRWPKAAAVTRSSVAFDAGRERRGARTDRDDARGDLGRRHEGARRHVEQDARLGQPLHQHRKPAIGFAARRRGEAQRDLALEHQGQAFVFADPVEPAEQQRRGDVVGQVGDDLARRLRTAPPGRASARRRRPPPAGRDRRAPSSRERGETARVALDRDDAARACREQRPRQARRGRRRSR